MIYSRERKSSSLDSLNHLCGKYKNQNIEDLIDFYIEESKNYFEKISHFMLENNQKIIDKVNFFKISRNTEPDRNFFILENKQNLSSLPILSIETDGIQILAKTEKISKNQKFNDSTFDNLDKKFYKCSFIECNKKYSSLTALNNHVENIHNNRNFRCLYCEKIYAHPYALKYHINKFHLNVFPYKCENKNCLKKFPTRSNYYSHLKNCKFTKKINNSPKIKSSHKVNNPINKMDYSRNKENDDEILSEKISSDLINSHSYETNEKCYFFHDKSLDFEFIFNDFP